MDRSATVTPSITPMNQSQENVGGTKRSRGPTTFFEKTPEGAAARGLYLRIYGGGLFAVILLLFTVFPIYWGALWHIPAHNLDGWLVDFDGGLLGQTLTQSIIANQAKGKITWKVLPGSDFPGGPTDIMDAVRNEETWVAITINPGSTDRLTAALAVPNPEYRGESVISVYAAEARNENGYRSIIRPSVQGILDVLTKKASQQIASMNANLSSLSSILATSPQTITSPVDYLIFNLIPFDQPVATASTFVGMLYQLIMGFFVVMICMGAREASGFEKTLTTKSLILLRFASSFFAYFMISLFYCLMNLAFKLDVSRKFGQSGFLVFWMVNYVGVLAVCLALESLVTLLTTRGIPFFMLTWIILNLSVSLFPLDIMPRFFKYGYAAPFFNQSRALRTIVFATRNRVGESVGVLLAWVIVSCISLPLIQWFVRRKAVEPQPAKPVEREVVDSEKNGESLHPAEQDFRRSREEKQNFNTIQPSA